MTLHPGLLLIGAAFLAAGIALLLKQAKRRKHNTSSVMAEVVRYHTERRADSDGESITHYPVMRYYVSGKWYENQHDVGRGTQKYGIGERVEILIDPENPDSFVIAGDKSMWIASVIAIILGVGVCILAFFAK